MKVVDLNGIGMTSQRTRERLIQRLVDQGVSNMAVLDVIRSTPRHLFLDEAMAHRAYEDVALPIGFQQTLSQPYIVARMTELLLAAGPRSRVLEIGTGSGYQTAVLAQLVEEVYSVERIKPLQQKARQRMRRRAGAYPGGPAAAVGSGGSPGHPGGGRYPAPAGGDPYPRGL